MAIFRAATGASGPLTGVSILSTLAWVLVLGAVGIVLQSRRDRVFVDLL